MTNIFQLLTNKAKQTFGKVKAGIQQSEDLLGDSFRQASEKIRSKGYFSLSDNEVKSYIEPIKRFALSKIEEVNQKMPLGLSLPTSFQEANQRAENMIGFTPEVKALQEKSKKVGLEGLTSRERAILDEPYLNTALMFGSTAPVRMNINNLTETALKGSKNQNDAIKRLGIIVDKALESRSPDFLQKLKTLRASLSRNMIDVTGASGTGNYKRDYAFFQRARSNPEVTKVVDYLEAQVLRLDDEIKNISSSALQKIGGEKTTIQGLMNESPAQTAFRRSAKLAPEDVYKGFTKAGDVIKKATSKYETGKAIPVEEFEKQMERINIPPSKKVNILDYLRTPENVLKKIGLEDESKVLRTAYDSYRSDLRNAQIQIANWAKQVPGRASSQAIFKYLDGETKAKSLSEEELKVADEIKPYLKDWAKRLGLPEDKQVSNYITHLFQRGQIEKEFDPELAKVIDYQIPGSVWNPFLQKRTDTPNYLKDTWRALDAYTKRATRDANMTPALSVLKDKAQDLDRASWKYIKSYADRINLRPTDVDELLDNLIKSTPIGYKATGRPTAYLTRKIRNLIFRGALGLNLGSALKNLTQGVNTYSVLGEKYTAIGYAKLAKNIATGNLDELYRYGVLDDNIIQDREIFAVKKALQKVDTGLWSFFDNAEKINRGSAFWGAKAKALAEGKTEAEAIEYGKKVVAKTQFLFNQIDTPVALSSDIAKLFTQFLSYPIKQTEFLAGMAKDKNFLGLLRYTIGSIVLTATVGKAFGLDLKNFVPFSEGRFTSPAGEAVSGVTKLLSSNEQTREEGESKLRSLIPLLFPAGVQLKKSIQGGISQSRGYVATPSGLVRYPVVQNPYRALQMLLLGQNVTPEAREYYGRNRSPLGEKQSELFKLLGKPYYDQIMRDRQLKKEGK